MLFLAATFFTQITMLNMLIAIMGDSFERVIENRDVNATRIKLNFMNDMAGTVGQRSSREEEEYFMYIVKPEDSDLLDFDEWEGTINKITHQIATDIDKLSKELHSKNEKLQLTMEDFIRVEQSGNRSLKTYVDTTVKASENQITERMAAMQDDIIKALRRVSSGNGAI